VTGPHPGRRGRALLGFAAIDTVWGVRLATVDPDATDFYLWLDTLSPLWWWSLPWFAVTGMCLVGAFQQCDRVAFGGAIGIKVMWGALYVSGQVLGEVREGWPSAAVWLGFAWLVWLVAGWPEPIDRKGAVWTPPLQ
jgi:hypothetical protein